MRLFNPGAYRHMHPDGQKAAKPGGETGPAPTAEPAAKPKATHADVPTLADPNEKGFTSDDIGTKVRPKPGSGLDPVKNAGTISHVQSSSRGPMISVNGGPHFYGADFERVPGEQKPAQQAGASEATGEAEGAQQGQAPKGAPGGATRPASRPAPQPRRVMAPIGDAYFPPVYSGQKLRSQSGRDLTVPTFGGGSPRADNVARAKLNAWLLDEARKEVAATGDTYLADMLKGLNPRNFSQGDRDTASDILFGPDGPKALPEAREIRKPKGQVKRTNAAADKAPPAATRTITPEDLKRADLRVVPEREATEAKFILPDGRMIDGWDNETHDKIVRALDADKLNDTVADFVRETHAAQVGLVPGDDLMMRASDPADVLIAYPLTAPQTAATADYIEARIASAAAENPLIKVNYLGNTFLADSPRQFRAEVAAIEAQASLFGGTPATTQTADLPSGSEPTTISANQESEDGDRSDSGGVGQPGDGGAGASGNDPRQPEGNRPAATLAPTPAEDAAPTGRGGVGGEDGVRPGSETLGGAPAVYSGGDAADGRGGAGDAGVVSDGTGGRTPVPAVTRPNFHIDDPKRIIGGTGPKQRFARNRAALKVLEEVQAEGRDPTQEELETMAGFIGWGSFGQEVFQGSFERQPYREGWEEEGRWLRDHLGKEAWDSARDSIRNAHYTDPPTVTAMWDMVRHMGFRGGRVLEPSMGVGNFFGLMPRDLMGQSDLTGIEKEKTTGDMAKLLYPHAGIHVKGYEESKTADNFYDLVIGNWPFAAQSPPDRRYDRLSPSLHNYFFLKALDQVRPGGLVVGITSNGTMDSAGRAARLEMAKKGKLIAAFRLPSGAFKDYAGTSVVADIVVLQKRAEPLADAVDEPWIDATEMSTEHGDIRVNRYFQDHPENVLGTLDWGHGTTSGRPGMIVHRPDDLEQRLQALPATLPTDAYQPVIRGKEARFLVNNTTDRHGSIVIGEDGHLYQVQGERLTRLDDIKNSGMTTGPAKVVKARDDQVRRMVGMRKTYGALIDADRDGKPEAEALRTSLKAQFDQFRAAHGPIGKSDGLRVLDRVKDPARSAVESLERPDGTPSRILTEPTVRSRQSLKNPSIADAFVLARNEQANFDLDRVAELTGKPRNVVEDVLLDQGAILRTPGGGFETTDDYLSGNVRRKLREAKEALAAGDEKMQPSIDALTKVLPPDTPYYNIEAKLGATWVGDDAYRAFIGDLLNLTPEQRAGVDVRFTGSRWRVRFDDRSINSKAEARNVHGHEDYRFDQLMMAAMGNRSVKITYRDEDNVKHTDEKATEEVNAKVQDLKDKFTDWAWSDPERKLAFEQAFNESMNAIAKPHFDGSFMDMSGMALRRGNDPFSLRRHQLNAIWRAVVLGRGLFAHEVGTGKSYTMAGVAVEGRRYGKFRKPLVFAHNANSAAVAQEFQDMYPGGKFFYISQLKPKDVATSLRRIANEDWDAVIMPHSLIEQMALTKPTLMALAAEQIAELENAAIEAAAEDNIDLTPKEIYSLIEASKTDKKAMGQLRSPTAKDVVRQIQSLLNNIEKQANRASKEDAVPFEQLGVDAIIVDECFPYDTPVLTNRGWLPIGQIVENKLPVEVLSYNFATKQHELKKVIRWIPVKRKKTMVRVTHEYGHFTCTADHKIWTSDGYIKAGALLPGAHLSCLRDTVQPGFGDIEFSRVAGVEVLEPGSPSEPGSGGADYSTVYDIEVVDNHNFFAAGVLVSNCHEFKKPPFATAMKMRGLNTSASDRSTALDFLTKYVKANNAGKGVFLFTGTPVTNTLNEIFNMARYFMDDRMEEAGIKEWDAWFNTFADATNDIELTSTGEIEPVKRLAAFNNVDELVRQMSEFVDVVQAKDMPEFKPRPTPSGKTLVSPDLTPEERDFLMNGRTLKPEGRPYVKVVTDVGEMSPAQVEILDELRELAREFKSADGKQKKEWMLEGDERVPIRIETNSANTGIDPRLYNPDAPDTEDSKINRIVRNVLRHYGEADAAQAIFVDRGFNPVKSSEGRESRFVVVDELIKKLVDGGIPREEIAVVAGGMKAEKKKEIADGMNSGKYRIAIGQSGTLGVGVNMQQRLRAIHHFDAPWRPGDLEQRNGRMNRQGNTWNMAYEYRYVTEGIDGRRWQVLQVKDKFIKTFIAAFNDTSGKRIGNIEGDAADMSEDEDFSNTLSAAAGDPRIMIRAKYKADVERLARRERLHTRGQAEAIQRVRALVRAAEEHQRWSAEHGRYADRWEASVDRAAKAAEAAGDDRKWYEIEGDPAQAAAKIAALEAQIAGRDGDIAKARQALEKAKDDGKPVEPHERRIARLTNLDEQAQAAIQTARSTGRWFETGADLQDALDKAILQVAKGEKRKLATVGGFDIVGDWRNTRGDAPVLSIEDPESGRQVTWLSGLTALRIANVLNDRRERQHYHADQAAQQLASIPALEAAGKQDFPQQEKLTKLRQQLAKLEDDLQANPNPPPSWLRNGAPMDTDIYVDGEPRTVRGHRVADDYYLVTDEGEVPYLAAMDANGLRMFTVHEPPQVVSRDAPDWVKPHLEATKGVSEGDPHVWHGELVWHNRDLALIRGTTNLWGADETAFLGFKKGVPAEPGRNHINMMAPKGFKPEEWARLTEARDDYLAREANKAALEAAPKQAGASAFNPTPGLSFSADAPDYGLRGGLAESSPVPLYSAVQRAADGLKQAKGTGEQMLAMIARTPGVKPEEVEWMGLDDWLKGMPSVTKQQIQDFVAANQLEMREVTKRDFSAALMQANGAVRVASARLEAGIDRNGHTVAIGGDTLWYDEVLRGLRTGGIRPDDLPDVHDLRDRAAAFVQADAEVERLRVASFRDNTRYKSYNLPGGKDYREMLITLPHEPPPAGHIEALQNGKFRVYLAGMTYVFATRAEAEAETRRLGAIFNRDQGAYKSGHWDEPNVVAHVRFDERTAPDGARVLMVQEVQSDLHQEARKKGYRQEQTDYFVINSRSRNRSESFPTREAADAYRNSLPESIREATSIQATKSVTGEIPSAPFKTSWPALVMRRMIKYAVDNGFDRVAWSPGQVHADRYSLSKRISRIEFKQSPRDPDGGALTAYDKRGNAVINQFAKTADLPEIIGKEATEKLLAQKPEGEWPTRTLRGLDLQVGGEGMKGFYDDILPKTVQKTVGRYGAKVIGSEIDILAHQDDPNRPPPSRAPRRKLVPVHSFDITDALRNAVETQGMALFERRRNLASGTPGTPIAPVVPRPASAPQTSRWPNGAGPGFRDLLSEAPLAGHDAAAAWVTQKGIETGHEYIAVVDNRTGEIVHAGTNGLKRQLGFDTDNGADEPGAYTIHHNHPYSTAISLDDILLARASPGISHVVAHGHDGSMTRVSGGTRMARASAAAIRKIHAKVEAETRVMLQWLVDQGKLDALIGDHFLPDVTNRFLSAEGVITYISSQQIPASIWARLRSKLRKLGYGPDVVDRSTVSVRPEERNAGLPGGMREDQGPRPTRSGPGGDGEGAGISGKAGPKGSGGETGGGGLREEGGGVEDRPPGILAEGLGEEAAARRQTDPANPSILAEGSTNALARMMRPMSRALLASMLDDLGREYRISDSRSDSENHGPSRSAYFTVKTSGGDKKIRLSDHFYPGNHDLDLRIGEPAAIAEAKVRRALGMAVPDSVAQAAQAAEAARVKSPAEIAAEKDRATLARLEAERAETDQMNARAAQLFPDQWARTASKEGRAKLRRMAREADRQASAPSGGLAEETPRITRPRNALAAPTRRMPPPATRNALARRAP
jgi:N12 class adenine-specific DNA methylase